MQSAGMRTEKLTVNSDFLRVHGVKGVLRVHKHCRAPPFLDLSDGVHSKGRLSATLWPINFHDSTLRDPSTEGQVQCVHACGNHANFRLRSLLAEDCDDTLAVLLLYVFHYGVESALPGLPSRIVLSAASLRVAWCLRTHPLRQPLVPTVSGERRPN